MMTIYDVHLRFTVSGEEPLPGKTVAKELSRHLNNWNDGRYPFEVEMIHKGLVWALSRTIRGCYITEDGGEAFLVVKRHDESEPEAPGKWRGLCRTDRFPDGSPGPYEIKSTAFESAETAREWAGGVSPSRHPIIIEEEKAATVLAALNTRIEL